MNSSSRNFYDVLQVDPTATPDQLKAAYKRMVMIWHPDRNRHNPTAAAERLQLINEAYGTLRDAELRALHDESLRSSTLNALNDNRGAKSGLVAQFIAWLSGERSS
jgi:curved DNA-binding protein CbpA